MRAAFQAIGAWLAVMAVSVTANGQDRMSWQPNLESAQRVAAQTNRLVLIHFWAPWCRPCLRIESEVFSNPETAQGLEGNFVMVKINADQSPAIVRTYGVSSLPADVITTPDGGLVSQCQSPPTSSQYVAQMNQAAAGHRSLARKPEPISTTQAAPGEMPAADVAAAGPSAVPAAEVAQAPAGAQTDRYAEYFPEQQGADPYGQVKPAQAYAAVPGAQPATAPPADPYAAPPQSTPPQSTPPSSMPPSADPYAAPFTPQPAADRYAAPPNAAPPNAPYAATAPATTAPATTAPATTAPPVNPYAAQAPPANPYAQQAPPANPFAAQTPPANPYAQQAPPANAYAPPAAPGNPYATPPANPPANPYGAPATPQAPPAANPYAVNPYQPPQQAAAPAAAAPQLPPGCPPVGLDGNCPVTLVERKRWVVGHPAFGAVHRGRTYLFLGVQEKEKFLANPDLYAPVMSGIDPVKAFDNQVSVPGKREFGVFGADGHIYLFADEASRSHFEQNEQHYSNRALQTAPTPQAPQYQSPQYQAMRPNP